MNENDELRRSITNQINREINSAITDLRKEINESINLLRDTCNYTQQAVNFLTEKLIDLAVRENDDEPRN